MASTESQPTANQAEAAGRFHANRVASRRNAPPTPPRKQEDAPPADKMEQLRISLDRLFSSSIAGDVASLATVPISLGLLFIRGMASMNALQSLPLRHIRFTETNPFKMLPDSKKMRPFTFTKRLGIIAAWSMLFIAVIILIIQIAPFAFFLMVIATTADLLNPLN
ncbi:hypothetical protein COV06_04450 [Candidatus Uhrbacteria bacterium CG10_big_fil_rev_8_21_14_0_10_50_16]|uniref:Uncharacterized protein n=1 Tax=Candidatus Uhrbacteria bacterium CG10_big_fil_rev_8_21_14_0_10_50_16 TaxID=1975039 RepID=A0A2H0RLC7_9BACT|nr:MAG: hypothetical protein COV06_04450 [Candidatus Uhrbacteria bacterium CG10_big_fil_rev_8_21_14_0_10_50_16]